MADTNGHDHEGRISRLEPARKETEDALVVMAHLESKAAARIKEYAEFIASEQEAMRYHTLKMKEFDEKLNALIDIGSRMQCGMETRPN